MGGVTTGDDEIETVSLEEMLASAYSVWDKPLWRRLPFTISSWWRWRRPHPLVEAKQFYQRGRYGVADRDMWDYFSFHARTMVRVCDSYLKDKHGHPCLGHFTDWDAYWKEHGHEPCHDCDCSDSYYADIKAMRDGFQLVADDDTWTRGEDGKYTNRPETERAIELFKEHYFSLWT